MKQVERFAAVSLEEGLMASARHLVAQSLPEVSQRWYVAPRVRILLVDVCCQMSFVPTQSDACMSTRDPRATPSATKSSKSKDP
jgi:hypothetical protein